VRIGLDMAKRNIDVVVDGVAGGGQNSLDTQNPSSYTRTVKKEVLINQSVLLYPLF